VIAPLASLASSSGASAASACAPGEACVIANVVGSQTSEHIISFAQVRAGDVSALYATRARAGGPTSSDTFSGLSVRDLIQLDVPLPTSAVTFVEITSPGYPTMTLSQADLGDPGDAGYPFPSGLLPAIFVDDAQTLGYISPLRNAVDASDIQTGQAAGPVTLTIHTSGRLLAPVVTATPSTIAAGKTVTFGVSFAQPAATALSYSWNFGAGADVPGLGATPSHTYANPGTFLVSVTVTGADSSYGISKPVTVTVNKPPPATNPGGGATAKPTPKPTTGPVTSSGSRGGGATSTKANPSQAKNGTTGTALTGSTRTPSTPSVDLPTVTGYLISGVAHPVTVQHSSARAATAPSIASGGWTVFGWKTLALAGTVALLAIGILNETGLLRRRPTTKSRLSGAARSTLP
jgi:PKD repeat protein